MGNGDAMVSVDAGQLSDRQFKDLLDVLYKCPDRPITINLNVGNITMSGDGCTAINASKITRVFEEGDVSGDIAGKMKK